MDVPAEPPPLVPWLRDAERAQAVLHVVSLRALRRCVRFATGVGQVLPPAEIPLRGLAGLVAYSRVHTGVHYPGDVVAGALIGTTLAQIPRMRSGPFGDDEGGQGRLRSRCRAGHRLRSSAVICLITSDPSTT